MGPSARPASSWGLRSVVSAWCIGTGASVAVNALVLVVGYGVDRLAEAAFITGVLVILLLIPFALGGAGRALALRWSATVTRVEILLWFAVSLLVWWLLPIILLPSGEPGPFGLALAVLPVSVQVLVAGWWLTLRAAGTMEKNR